MISDKIILNEVGLREGFQNLRRAYNTELKLSALDGFLQAGVRHIQLDSIPRRSRHLKSSVYWYKQSFSIQ